ncbi:MAG: hypothetical protein KDK45_25965, partial [Leptospiraceae bacterium]|nr:hypothetical protein [Leptospiraceae bacterium]
KVVERESYKLQKNGPGVYKLEGTESDGRTYSIIIATGNYLREAGGKINGFIHLEEAELNRALQVEHSSLRSFFSEIKNIQVEDYSGILQNNQVMELSWEEILDWERFWKEQLLLLLNPNQVALLLVTLGLTFKRFFYETATDKQKQIVSDELFYLNQGVGEAASPHTRNKGIMNFDSAKRTFLDSYLSIKEKREKEQGTEKPSGNEKKNRLKSALRGI